ncbi:MAG: NlpC/P60 family protein [Patescibacteria group bacterium]
MFGLLKCDSNPTGFDADIWSFGCTAVVGITSATPDSNGYINISTNTVFDPAKYYAIFFYQNWKLYGSANPDSYLNGLIGSHGSPNSYDDVGNLKDVYFQLTIQPAETPIGQAAAELAKELVNQPEAYLWGGKGWDYNQDEFVASANVLSGYTYWNPNLPGFDTGIGVDCSGLITWAFNRAFDAFTPAVNNFVKYVNANGLYGDYQSDAIIEAELLPGDAMFFDWDGDEYIDHSAMYVGESGGYDVVNAKSRDFGIVTEVKDNYKLTLGFKSFRRIHEGNVEMEITTGSPIDLVVIDPDGLTITPNSIISSDDEYIREIPGVLYYLEIEQGSDGNPIDRVYSPVLKTGDYTIHVVPASGASPTSTYTLDFSAGNQSIMLAQNVPVSQIPANGYGITTSVTGTINSFIPVSIDIKPDSYPNSINLGSNGVVPVSIFGSATFFDVRQIDPVTIKLANASVKLNGNGQPMVSYSDVNGDGFTDITVKVLAETLELTEDDVNANLEGRLFDGTIIKGADSVRIIP